MSGDEEKDIGETLAPDGYPSLAKFIAKHRDHSTAIYLHCDDLSARNILYLQSELAELRALQLKYDREDAEPGEIDAKERCRD
jgi:ABC-type phosphate transport system auxiliary subunit